MEQELLILPKQLRLPSVFSWDRVSGSLVLCVSLVDRCLSFYTFSFPIVLSVLRFPDSDYPFGIFKLFLSNILLTQLLL